MNILERLFELIAPDDCVVCGDEGSLLCEACRISELIVPAPACFRCGAVSRGGVTCQKCRKSSPLSFVWAASSYEGPAKELVALYKYQSKRSAASPLASAMMGVVDRPTLDKCLVTSIPTSSRRIRQRGFDHARRLAEEIAKSSPFDYHKLLLREFDVHQVGATKAIRRQQVAGMFEVLDAQKVRGGTVLLVDDVLTTGATLEEAARTLKRAGAKEVGAVVFARVK